MENRIRQRPLGSYDSSKSEIAAASPWHNRRKELTVDADAALTTRADFDSPGEITSNSHSQLSIQLKAGHRFSARMIKSASAPTNICNEKDYKNIYINERHFSGV